MATYYVDYEGGNDASAGTSFATRWKTITSGPTAARTAPGDTVRIMGSPAPVDTTLTATWTNKSKTVTTSSAPWNNLHLDGAFTTSGATGVTCTTSTTRKQGSNSASIAITGSTPTGRIAYLTVSSRNLSAYSRVTFWIRCTISSSAAFLTLKLCSDTTGQTEVDKVTIAASSMVGASSWRAFVLDRVGGGTFGTAIQSVGVYLESNPGACTILLDNIMAVKANSSADSINLTSLISKGGSENYYPIQSINGTSIILDNITETGAAETDGKYGGATASSVALYRRETIKIDPVATATTAVHTINEGSVTYSGGWNRTDMSTQDSETWYDSQSGNGYGIYINSLSSITMEKVAIVKTSRGFYVNGSTSCTLTIPAANACDRGLSLNNSSKNTITISGASNNDLYGISLEASDWNIIQSATWVSGTSSGVGLYVSDSNGNKFSSVTSKTNSSYGIQLVDSGNNCFKSCISNDNGDNGIYFSRSHYNSFNTLTTTGNSGNGVYFTGCATENYFYFHTSASNTSTDIGIDSPSSGVRCYFKSPDLASGSGEFGVLTDGEESRVTKIDDLGSNFSSTETDDGWIIQNKTVANGYGGNSIHIMASIQSNRTTEQGSLVFLIAEVAVEANAQVTATIWSQAKGTFDYTARFVCRGGQIAGVANDVIDAHSAAIDTWEQLQIQFTPTEAGVVELEIQMWTPTGNSRTHLWDEFEVTQ